MKKLLVGVFALISYFSNAQISVTGGAVYFSDASLLGYYEPSIYVIPEYNPNTGNVRVVCRIMDPSIEDYQVAESILIFTKTHIDTFTGAGASDTEKFHDAVSQAVKDYLDGLTKNSGLTISL